MRGPSRDFRDYYTGKEGYPPREAAEPKRKRTPIEWAAQGVIVVLYFVIASTVNDGHWILSGFAAALYGACVLVQVLVPWREKRRAPTT